MNTVATVLDVRNGNKVTISAVTLEVIAMGGLDVACSYNPHVLGKGRQREGAAAKSVIRK